MRLFVPCIGGHGVAQGAHETFATGMWSLAGGRSTGSERGNRPAGGSAGGKVPSHHPALRRRGRIELDGAGAFALFRPTSAAGYDMLIGDVRLTNAVTVEHNTLGPGVIGHIMRHRTIDTSNMAATDRWFHYDQVGSILCETNASGAHAQRHDQDAFGNTLDTWQTGLVGGDQLGWHHNTKEMDADTGMTYMHQRWYNPSFSSFLSKSPLPLWVEGAYTFVLSQPVMRYDPFGLKDIVINLAPGEQGHVEGAVNHDYVNDSLLKGSLRCVAESGDRIFFRGHGGSKQGNLAAKSEDGVTRSNLNYDEPGTYNVLAEPLRGKTVSIYLGACDIGNSDRQNVGWDNIFSGHEVYLYDGYASDSDGNSFPLLQDPRSPWLQWKETDPTINTMPSGVFDGQNYNVPY